MFLGVLLGTVLLVLGGDDRIDEVRGLLRGAGADYERLIAQGEAAVAPLAAILADAEVDGTTRFTAANALGDVGSAAGVEPLIAALGDSYFNVRRCAALALGRIGDPRARKPLETLAETDPYRFHDPETGEDLALVRIDARRALEMLGATVSAATLPEALLDDASRPPPLPPSREIARVAFPFPGDAAAQRLFNNYQQATDSYVHAGLDLIHPAGTEVRAVAGGVVAAIATNYPDWSTHHFFIISPEEGSDEGWCYTHIDPATYTFRVGDRIRPGAALGKLVDFSLGEKDGVDHLHLHYVRFSHDEDGRVETTSLFDPLLALDWSDTADPVVHGPLRFVAAGTLREFPAEEDGIPVVHGDVDIIAGFSDQFSADGVGNLMVAAITLEIRGEGGEPWRKLVLDERGEVPFSRAAPALHVRSADSRRWREGKPPFPAVFHLVVTNSDGDGIIEPADSDHSWRTAQLGDAGAPRFHDGLYEVTVRAWDVAGNRGERTAQVRVRNRRAAE